MRVLHLTTEFPPTIFGGLGTAVGGLARASAKAGVQVRVLLIGSALSGYEIPTPGGPDQRSSGGPEVPADPEVTLFSASCPDAVTSAHALCRLWRPDVVHLHVFWLWDIARQLCEQAGLPLLYTVHSLDVAEYQLGNGPSECLDQWQVQQAVLAFADVIHAPSASEAELVAHHCPTLANRIGVAGHGIDNASSRSNRQQQPAGGEVTVLFVGRFVDRKGIRELLAAIPSVLQRAPKAQFVLSGGHRGVSGPEMQTHWLPAELASCRDRIRFTGWLSPEETADWYARADILAIPSWYEPFGMVVLEGMLHGIAIAAADVGGPGEILEHERTALLFTPRDVDALAEAVTRLAIEPGLRHRLGAAAAQDVRHNWLWPSAIAKLHALYARAISTADVVKATA